MTAFDARKTAAEAKFTHDQEFQFKTIARRNKLLGLWAAEQMGISGADAEAYAKQVVIADFEEPGDADVVAEGARRSDRQRDRDGREQGASRDDPSARPKPKRRFRPNRTRSLG